LRYAVVVEKGETSFGAYVPDLPDCIAAADTREEVLQLIHKAMEFHVEGLREYGQPIPNLPQALNTSKSLRNVTRAYELPDRQLPFLGD
jgi:predicted RNase H-like HicB family nuclease